VRTRAARPFALVPLLVCALLVAACSGGASGRTGASSTVGSSRSADPTPALGGPPVARVSPPPHAMDRLERPVAAQLAREVARQGLTLSYLDCPRWDGRVPGAMACHGYVDGLRVRVDVRFTRAVQGKAVGFDARLSRGVIATRNLERTLVRQRGGRADCGDGPAYPARRGTRIVCRVTHAGAATYVVATVRDRSGAVTIADYSGTSASP